MSQVINDAYATKECKPMFDSYVVLFESGDLMKMFENLDGKMKGLYSWDKNAYRKPKNTHL